MLIKLPKNLLTYINFLSILVRVKRLKMSTEIDLKFPQTLLSLLWEKINGLKKNIQNKSNNQKKSNYEKN